MLHIKKNDQIIVIAGRDKGKTGKVLEILPKSKRAIVEHINVVKKSQRKTQENQQGGVIEIEASIHLSNISLIDKKTNKPTRFGIVIQKDGSKARVSKKSGEVI